MDTPAIDLKKKVRLKEWTSWLREFKKGLKPKEKSRVEIIENGAELLNDYYWRLAKQFIRPLLQDKSMPEDHNIHYYKIISASELTVMAVLPFKFREGFAHIPEDRCEINARFAFVVATSIMLNWKINSKEVVDIKELSLITQYVETIDVDSNNNLIPYPYNFTQEHIAWLQQLNVNGPLPVLSNSQTWRLCYHACMAIRKKGKF